MGWKDGLSRGGIDWKGEQLQLKITSSNSFFFNCFILNSQAMTPQLIFALLLVLAAGANNCAQADEIECLSSICPNYYYVNATCYLNSSATCTTKGFVYYNGVCVNCVGLASSNCSVVCPDFLYYSSSSVPAVCKSCQQLYGDYCIRCTSTNCLICAYSSNLALATDKSGCVNNNCAASNCMICYTDGSRCYKCKSGYIAVNFVCVATTCSILNCITCVGNICGNCFPGYQLSNGNTGCQPICTDTNCLNCIAPGICGSCATAYLPVNGICTINCALISVANCMTCQNYATCTQCVSGYSISSSGNLCVPTCQVTKCNRCVSGDTTTCRECVTGYAASSDGKTCTQGICQIDYCNACSSMSACSACITGFTLSTDNMTCTSNCLSTLQNCIFCSSSSTCTDCEAGYVVSASGTTMGKCVFICASITNCIRCKSETQCSSCANNYQLSADLKSCSIACKVSGCLVCADSTSYNCTTCQTGYTADQSGTRTTCKKNCREGQVNTASSGVTCQRCKDVISHCDRCDQVSSTIVCLTCSGGYFVNGNQCDKCDSAITKCLTCTNSFTCNRCYQGYKLIEGTCSNTGCASSVTNCYSCKPTSTGVCYRCNPGYFLNGSSICEAKSCSVGFIFDESSNACACPTGSYMLNGACYPCKDKHCSSCTVSVCSSCKVGYYPVGTTCNQCITNCKSCTSASNCVECNHRYSLNADGLCVPFGGGKSCAVSNLGLIFRCDPGCRVCVIGVSSALRVVCIVPNNGYSIVGGEIVRCDPSCQSCSSYVPTLCTSCYSRSVLIAGACSSCTDPNALECSQYNPAYSTVCKLGYTAAYSATSTPGTCSLCSQFCRQCDTAGPGNCDSGQCMRGSVQLLGTSNCSICFNGCVTCSNSDPNNCLDCGNRRYSSGGDCLKCPTGCTTCLSSTNCQNCDLGYWLVGTSCNAIPDNCIGLDSNTGLCTGCFQAYKLTADSKGCEIDLSCNTTTCESCPNSYFLFSSKCYTCNVGANCIACQTTNSSLCLSCSNGFYLDSNYNCVACTTNCDTCDSASFCTKASSGYFVKLLDSGDYSGETAQCLTPCATCTDTQDFCLSCLTGYSLYGSTCRRNLFLTIIIVLGQSRSGNSIFSDSESASQQLFFGIRSFNRLGGAIDLICPSRFKDGRHWRRRMRFRKIKFGSISTELNLQAGSYTDGSTATSDLTNSLVTSDIDGARYISSSVTAEGFTSTTGSSTSLGLVLGLSIPLSILLVLIIVLEVYSYRKETDTGEKGGNGFYSEDVIEKEEEI